MIFIRRTCVCMYEMWYRNMLTTSAIQEIPILKSCLCPCTLVVILKKLFIVSGLRSLHKQKCSCSRHHLAWPNQTSLPQISSKGSWTTKILLLCWKLMINRNWGESLRSSGVNYSITLTCNYCSYRQRLASYCGIAQAGYIKFKHFLLENHALIRSWVRVYM